MKEVMFRFRTWEYPLINDLHPEFAKPQGNERKYD
jgi:hypothetical protein